MTLAPWKKTYDQSRQRIKKQRHYFVDKVLSSQSYGFSSGHVWMWEMYSLCQQSDIKKKLTDQMAILLASTPKPWSEVLVVHLCPTLGDPMECSPPGSSVHGIFHARILEWVAIYFSRGSSWPRDQTQVSCTTGRFFTKWAMREALWMWELDHKESWTPKNWCFWSPGELPVPLPDPQVEKSYVGPRTFATVGELLLVLFSCYLRFWCFCRRRWAYIFLLSHLAILCHPHPHRYIQQCVV